MKKPRAVPSLHRRDDAAVRRDVLAGERENWPEPWISGIDTGGVGVVTVHAKLATIVSGGSSVSWSCAAVTEIVSLPHWLAEREGRRPDRA